MYKIMTTLLVAALISGNLLGAAPTNAQSGNAPVWLDKTSQHHQRLYLLMKDMTDLMGKMTEQMRSDLTSDQRLLMAQQMQIMSTLMRRLSGLEARPAMSEGEWQKQTDQMRQQMDEMIRESRMVLPDKRGAKGRN